MYVENNTDEIRMTAASWFLRKKKISTRIEIIELSCLIFLMEMIIPCALPQNKKKSFLKFQTGQLSRIILLKFSHIGYTHCLIRNLNFDWSLNSHILQKNFILIVSHKWSFQLINSVLNKNFLFSFVVSGGQHETSHFHLALCFNNQKIFSAKKRKFLLFKIIFLWFLIFS